MTKKLTLISTLYSWMVSHPIPVRIINLLLDSIEYLDGEGSNVQRLLTAAVGISAEGGEFMEIVKKMLFQGKPWTDDNREHLIIELGDVLWYVMQACKALEVSIDDVVAGNVEKLRRDILVESSMFTILKIVQQMTDKEKTMIHVYEEHIDVLEKETKV